MLMRQYSGACLRHSPAGESRVSDADETMHLLAAGRQHGVDHYVALSIVGSDRIAFGYYFGKRPQDLQTFDEWLGALPDRAPR